MSEQLSGLELRIAAARLDGWSNLELAGAGKVRGVSSSSAYMVPRYEELISSAWPLLEKWRTAKIGRSIAVYSGPSGFWVCRLSESPALDPDKNFTGRGLEAPEAICRALVAAAEKLC